jgi:type II secretory pathway pseudopilin PulG
MATFERLDKIGALKRRAAGFTYLAVLLLIALMGLGMAAAGMVWHTQLQREKEQDLLFVGDQYRSAIQAYYNSTPGAGKQYPTSLNALLKDPRFPGTRRYLRRLYADPITGSAEWGLVLAPGNGIMGVYSLGGGEPFKQANFRLKDVEFEHKQSYADWKFTVRPVPVVNENLRRNPR